MKKAPFKKSKREFRFESVKIDSLFVVLDAVAWIDTATVKAIATYAAIDYRTAGRLLKNARLIGLIEMVGDSFILIQPYPYKGTNEQKQGVVREALLRHPVLERIRQFMGLGDNLADAMRKAMVVSGALNYDASAVAPLVTWAQKSDALSFEARAERLVNEAVAAKVERHAHQQQKRIVFISHSSKDKPFVRKLAGDLLANGVQVWLDELRIHVGDSIPSKIAKGLAESDFFLIVISQNSVQSPWVENELDNALVKEIESKRVHVLPLKIDNAKTPGSISSKKHANFATSYDEGLKELIDAIKAQEVIEDGR